MKRTLLASAALAALATGFTTPAAWAEEVYDLDEILLSPSHAPVEAARTGATVEIIDEEDLEDSDTTLIQTLSREPGVSFSANGGVGSNTTIRLRGLDSKYIGVRIDGIDVSDPTSTQNAFNFGGLTSAGIGRIEVLKGSQSAIHGSEAIAGVINITSKRPTKLGFSGSVGGEIGSFGTVSSDFTTAYMDDRAEISFTLSRFHTEGISATAGDPEKDGFDQTMANFNSRFDLTDTLTIGASALWRDYEVEIDGASPNNLGTQKGARVFAEFVTGAVTHELSYSYYETDRRDPASAYTTRFLGDREQISYLGSIDLGAIAALTFGLDHTEETASLTTAAPATTVNTIDTDSAFAELLVQPVAGLDLSLALRRDEHSLFGGATTGRVAAVWHLADDLRLRAVYGTGFRAPSLFELYSASGNPALQPEESRSFELGLEKDFAPGNTVRVTAFRTDVDDLIEYFDPDGWLGPIPGAYAQVPGTTSSKGLELSGTYVISETLAFYGNYTFTDADNSGPPLARVPKHDLVLGLDATFGNGFTGNAEMQHVADITPSIYAPAGHKVGDYTLVNLGVGYDINDSVKAYLRLENALDEDYETAGGYNTPGRAAYFGIRASF